MNHLTEAKRIATEPYARADIAELQIKDINEKDYFAIIAHALIAIAEQLEISNSRNKANDNWKNVTAGANAQQVIAPMYREDK